MGNGGPDDNDAQAGRLVSKYEGGASIVTNDSCPVVSHEETPAIKIGTGLGINSAPVVMRQREGKPGGGKGPLMAEDESLTLAKSNDQTVFVKAQKAHDPDDCERWEETDTHGTLGGHGTTTGSAVAEGMAVRRLTTVECCRLQGFPDDWFGEPNAQPDGPRYAGLGDAVTVNVAEWIGRRIMSAERTGGIPLREPSGEMLRRRPSASAVPQPSEAEGKSE